MAFQAQAVMLHLVTRQGVGNLLMSQKGGKQKRKKDYTFRIYWAAQVSMPRDMCRAKTADEPSPRTIPGSDQSYLYRNKPRCNAWVLCAVNLLFKIQPRSSRPPLVYLNKSNCCSFQTSASFLSSVSMVSSLMAALVISEISGPYWCSRIANMLPSVNVLGSMSNFWPAAHSHGQYTRGLPHLAYVLKLDATSVTMLGYMVHESMQFTML